MVEGATQVRIADLGIAEQFVLWALRIRLEGRSGRDRLEEGFRLARADAGGAALEAFEPWLSILATSCWRDLYLHRACCPCLSGDERAILGLVASAQVGDEAGLRAIVAVLVHPRAHGSLRVASWRFAGALGELGLHLPRRRAPSWRASALLH